MKGSITYRRLGDYIIQRREKNNGYDVPIRGVSREGFINPKQQDADISLYNVFYKYDFVFNPARMELNSIALNEEFDKGICSSLYEIFYIKDTNELEPLYLNLLLKREHFTRFCNFVGWGSVREYCRFADISEYIIPVPDIDEQRKIVRHYNAIRTRIENNKKTIAKLEEAAQVLYRKMFVDGIDVERLPEGWRMGTLGEVCEITMGQSPDGSTYNEKGEGMIFYQGRTDYGYRFPSIRMYTTAPTRIAKLGDVLLSVRAPVGDLNIAPHDCCIGRGLAALRSKIGCNSFIYYLLQTKEHDFNVSNEDGTVFGSITKDDLFGLSVVIPDEKLVVDFESKAKILDNDIKLLDNEINKITEMLLVVMA